MPITVTIQDVITIERSETLPDKCPGCGATTIGARVKLDQLEGSTQTAVNVDGVELDDWSINELWLEGFIALAYKCGECDANLVPPADEININELLPGDSEEGARSALTTAQQITQVQACLQRHIARTDAALVREQAKGLGPDDECPNCLNGTLEDHDHQLICRGECGQVFEKR